MIRLSDQQLLDFCAALEWETGTRLPDGRILGNAARHGYLAEAPDYRIDFLARRLGRPGGSVLEIGCGEGYHTVGLAGLFDRVTAVEVRPKNVACALVNLFVHDVRNARILLGDVRDLDPGLGRFDVVFHSGVLYHLMDPVAHLHRIAGLADSLLLDTHYSSDGTTLERSDIAYDGRRYRAHVWREGGWGDVFSGVEASSRWLHRDSLMRLLQDLGFASIESFAEYEDAQGPRLGLWARRGSG